MFVCILLNKYFKECIFVNKKNVLHQIINLIVKIIEINDVEINNYLLYLCRV